MRKFKLECKKDYSEHRHGKNKTFLFKGKIYDVVEEVWYNKAINPITGMDEVSDPEYYRKVLIPPSFVAFLTKDIFEYFYTESEMRDMKINQVLDGI